jgi:hypothetical protein
MRIIEYLCILSPLLFVSIVAGISVKVDPDFGDNSLCSDTLVCQTIARAAQIVGVSEISLVAGILYESTVSIDNVAALAISGVPRATVIDCSRRPEKMLYPAFNITNSTVTFSGISFQDCSNIEANGGAISAIRSSITVLHCHFINCNAASGGAISATGERRDTFLDVQYSNFTRNAAVGGIIGCSQDAQQPCSAWGGAIAVFEILNVSIIGCAMVENSVTAAVPADSSQSKASKNSICGGGCVSVLFRGNSSGSTMYFSGNTFLHCTVNVTRSSNVAIGNGDFCLSNAHCSLYDHITFELI